MSHKSLTDATNNAKKFSHDTAIVRDETSGEYAVIRVGDVAIIPDHFKHVATVKVITTHEVTIHD